MRGILVNNLMYCLNGHYIGVVKTAEDAEDFYEAEQLALEELAGRPGLPAYCPKCGAKTIKACPKCESPIRYFRDGNAYCGGCGSPFPWTETALQAATEYTDEIDELNVEDKTALKETFRDLTVDTARTPLAMKRFKRVLTAAGPVAQEMVTKILSDVMTQSVKTFLLGG
jgi:hypothetical protein